MRTIGRSKVVELSIGDRVRCRDDGVQGRVVRKAKTGLVYIRWDDGMLSEIYDFISRAVNPRLQRIWSLTHFDE